MGHSEQRIIDATHRILQGHELLVALTEGMNEARNTLYEEAKFCDHVSPAGQAIHKLNEQVQETMTALLDLSAQWPTMTCAEVVLAGAVAGDKAAALTSTIISGVTEPEVHHG